MVSPGGFLPGVTEANVLWQVKPRNRRIAEVLSMCGLVERAGQGMNRMFEECIKESKSLPDFSGTDEYQVSVSLRGNIQDPDFLRFLEQVGKESLTSYSTEDFLVLDLVRREQPISANLASHLQPLVEQGVIERVGSGRGTRHILSRRFYSFVGAKGAYTRKRGLDTETNKMMLLRHISDNRQDGSPLRELRQVLPALSYTKVQRLLQELKKGGLAHPVGRTKGARWYPGPRPSH